MTDADKYDPPRSLYDPPEEGPEDLWFLPPEDPAGLFDLPWQTDEGSPGIAPPHPEDWQAAEARHAVALARAAAAFGALDERLRRDGTGLLRRLARQEAADLGWHLGDRVPADRLNLYLMLRLPGAGDDPQALARAAWAVRRLEARAQPQARDLANLAGFLSREVQADPAATDLVDRPLGGEFSALAAEWQADLSAPGGLHPITRAALGWGGWRRLGLSGESAMIEGAVAAARIGAVEGRGGLPFLPLGAGGGQALRAFGPPDRALPLWYAGVTEALQSCLMLCDRVADWLVRAGEGTADLSGRTPPLIIGFLAGWPLVSAPMLEKLTGASRAAVQRNLILFQQRGLVRELTGQDRFRFWAAAL
ncbi:MAG: hypothetical protein ACK5IB_09620 [Qingshengfaniella sp.]